MPLRETGGGRGLCLRAVKTRGDENAAHAKCSPRRPVHIIPAFLRDALLARFFYEAALFLAFVFAFLFHKSEMA